MNVHCVHCVRSRVINVNILYKTRKFSQISQIKLSTFHQISSFRLFYHVSYIWFNRLCNRASRSVTHIAHTKDKRIFYIRLILFGNCAWNHKDYELISHQSLRARFQTISLTAYYKRKYFHSRIFVVSLFL